MVSNSGKDNLMGICSPADVLVVEGIEPGSFCPDDGGAACCAIQSCLLGFQAGNGFVGGWDIVLCWGVGGCRWGVGVCCHWSSRSYLSLWVASNVSDVSVPRPLDCLTNDQLSHESGISPANFEDF